MRSDMFEVIIERPRFAGRARKGRRGERTERAFERAPKRQGMRQRMRTKTLNENLAPLRRFLASNVGRPWNKVRSELSAVLSCASHVQAHVIVHAREMVIENPVMIAGVAHYPNATRGVYRPLRAHPRWPTFYVCPKSGLLRAAKWQPRRDAWSVSERDAPQRPTGAAVATRAP